MDTSSLSEADRQRHHLYRLLERTINALDKLADGKAPTKGEVQDLRVELRETGLKVLDGRG